jgi:hypothetical protein
LSVLFQSRIPMEEAWTRLVCCCRCCFCRRRRSTVSTLPVCCASTAATPLIFIFCKFACFSLCKQTLVVLRSLAS